jgi:hypothetical protein
VAESYGLGGNHFITKPGTPGELEVKLATLLRNLVELEGIQRGSKGPSTTAVSAVNPSSMAALTAIRWAAVVALLVALYIFGRISGVF